MRALFMVLAWSVATMAAAQPSRDIQRMPQAAGTAAITGVVMSDVVMPDGARSDGAQPKRLRRARVTLNGADLWVGRTAITNDAGGFTFDRLPAGRYSVSATKEGYVAMSYGATRPGRAGTGVVVRAGESRHIRIGIPRGAVITGSILSADGEPAPGIAVTAMAYRYSTAAGERRLTPVGTVTSPTDDRGVYRIYGLPAGDYVIGAQMRLAGAVFGELQVISPAEVRRALAETRETGVRSRPGFQTRPPQAPVKPEPRKNVSPAPVYYPGTTVIANARTVTVGVGEERAGVNFDLEYVPTTTVSGSVGWSGSGQPPAVMLIATGEGVSTGAVRNARPDRDGRFTMSGVTPGQYTLMARSMPGGGSVASVAGVAGVAMWGSTDIIVNGQDEVDIGLSLQPGLVISGRVAFEGARPAPPSVPGFRLHLPAALQLGGVSMPLQPVVLEADGRFSINAIMPGRYRMGAVPQGQRTPLGGWWLKSVVIKGRDILDTPLDLRQSAADAVVTLSDQATELTGASSGTFVIVFSTDKNTWFFNSRRVVGIRPDGNERYTIRNLPAGDYFVVAADDIEAGEWYDPIVLQQMSASATRITLGEAEKKTHDVR